MGPPSAPRVLVAPDSFKGTFTALEVATAIGGGVADAGGEPTLRPLADGGEGTMQILLDRVGGELVPAPAHDPLGRPITACYAALADGTAVVEVAQATGLPLLSPEERDAEKADSAGTGELIAAAAEAGAERVVVAAGGSASTDGGRGAIEAIRAAGGLRGARLEVLCDVETRFEDAARVFAPQKGADPAAVERLTARLHAVATSLPKDPRGLPMTGCAGGISGGLMAAFGATLHHGAAWIFDAVGLDEALHDCTMVITGEGQIDAQSLEGKLVGHLVARCVRAAKPVHAVVGRDALAPATSDRMGLASITEATDQAQMRRAGRSIAARVPDIPAYRRIST
jgi:glycerate kinase